jgi:NNP family nitrate/nitrite transporter-like MFS transporter
MVFNPAVLFKHPQTHPINGKAFSVPIFVPTSKFFWTFHLGWLGFWVAFMSWFAFSPLITLTIKADLKLTQAQIGNSNILSLVSTLLVRAVAGPLCDRFGPRLVFAGVLLAGAIPTICVPAVTNVTGLIIVRFAIGILGGSFVPCQVSFLYTTFIRTNSFFRHGAQLSSIRAS